jgi:hypothetical protein
MVVIMWEKELVWTREVDQLQARWLHALSCLIVLTGNRRELLGLVMTRLRRLAGLWRGNDQNGAQVVLAKM